MSQEVKEHIHLQGRPYRFQSSSLAPISPDKGGSGRPRFSVEPMIYVSGSGWDEVNIFTQGNEFVIGFRDYVRMKEMMGYDHTGKTSQQITEMIKSMWGGKDY